MRKRSTATPNRQMVTIGKWDSIKALLTDVNRAAQALDQNTIDEKKAKVMCTLFRCGATVVNIMLTHAQATGRLKKGQASLPGFSLK